MRTVHLLFMSTLFLLAGCVPSLHALYTDETLVFDPAIEGRWQQQDNDYLWEFVPDAESKSYALTIHEGDDTTSKLIAHLVEIDGQRFFDFYPDRDSPAEIGFWAAVHLVRTHLFLKVHDTEPDIVMSAMVPDTIDTLLKDNPERVRHERLEDRIVLTDTPSGLQAFVTAGLDIEDFFSEPGTLKRITESEPNGP